MNIIPCLTKIETNANKNLRICISNKGCLLQGCMTLIMNVVI